MNPAAFIFDAYGTLFDVASVGEACAGLASDPARLVALWRKKQLEYSFLRALMGPAAYVDFWQVTADALDFAAEQLELSLSGAERGAHWKAGCGCVPTRGWRCPGAIGQRRANVRHPLQRQPKHVARSPL